ncbi:PLP-dependent aminotransferase family protein [Arthrobacter sp. STN4]|uniref:aminotransferase-like domain-containing protein n=1 Tax=Arthrobacter sp. STN4 TaxID=2923276 RepID=UPI002119DC5F|nr:PLP-dependent aminotransferase family protein [Arthrobacter sp. STN4]MCQ9164515.1 PLP-dependent aminotransferase family protein [Arthrobacter sp. STN4]
MISLAGGNPDLTSLPLTALGKSAQAIIAQTGQSALQYGAGQGTEELRTQICALMAMEGIIDASPDNVAVTIGSQSALDTITKILCNPGDTILTDEATYMGALGTFSGYQTDVQPVRTDGDGLIPEELELRIRALQDAGKRIKFLYIIPNFNNPTGITLAARRRDRVAQICRAANIFVVEDNPYGLLRFGGERLPALRATNRRGVIYLGSFSKIFSPGLRIGWALLPPPLVQKFLILGGSSTLCPPALNQMLVSAYLRDFDWQAHLAAAVATYQLRRDAMLAALDRCMPAEVTWTKPEGGFFIWLTLPKSIDTHALVHRALDDNVAFFHGAAFLPVPQRSNQLRLAFSAIPAETIAVGVQRLSRVICDAIGMAGGNAAQPARDAGTDPDEP